MRPTRLVIAKVGNDKFVKYHCRDLVKFAKFLDEKFTGWRWFNVYDKDTGEQIDNYTNKCRPSP